MGEVQKYMRFVFTGHLAIVLVFVVGAVGYQYSEWLKVVDRFSSRMVSRRYRRCYCRF